MDNPSKFPSSYSSHGLMRGSRTCQTSDLRLQTSVPNQLCRNQDSEKRDSPPSRQEHQEDSSRPFGKKSSWWAWRLGVEIGFLQSRLRAERCSLPESYPPLASGAVVCDLRAAWC